MFGWLSEKVTKHPIVTICAWVIVVLTAVVGTFAGFGGQNLFERLRTEAMSIPGSESVQVSKAAQSGPDQGPSLVVVISGINYTDVSQMQTVTPLVADLQRDLTQHVDAVRTINNPLEIGIQETVSSAFLSKNQDGFVLQIELTPGISTEAEQQANSKITSLVDDFQNRLQQHYPNSQADVMSHRIIADAILDQVQVDLLRGEAVSLPVALILMILVFGGFLAAGLPLLGALAAINVGLFSVWILTFATNVDSFIINIVTLVGLALSIDYGLLMVSRYREEMFKHLQNLGYPPDGSVLPAKAETKQLVKDCAQITLQTSGRTVFFSALTIALSILSLLTMEGAMLRIIGICGCLVVLMAVISAITLVPALLTLVGHRIIRLNPLAKIPGLKSTVKAFSDVSSDEGFFSQLARWVHRHPWPVMSGMLLILVAMVLPLQTASARHEFSEYIPKNTAIERTYNRIQNDYPMLAEASIVLVAKRSVADTGEILEKLNSMKHVNFVAPAKSVAGDDSRSIITANLDLADKVGSEATDVALALREWDPGYEVLVGGPAMIQYDFNQSVLNRTPLALTIMICTVLLLLFFMTGSLIVPLKALIINTLSLAAALGVTWLFFEHGWLGLPKTLGLETFVAACAISFGFGLAMDYEVFLLARIKEYFDAGESNDAAVEHGLQKSGRIITSAAAIIVAVFFGFVLGDLISIKQIGVALAFVVITDATLVRMLLVPATMTVLGNWNWWSPKPLRKLYQRFHITH